MLPRAGGYADMLGKTVTTNLTVGPQLDEVMDGGGWRNRFSQYKGKRRRTKWSYIPCYDDLSLSAIQYCIPAFDPSLKHTSVVIHIHTPTHTQTLYNGWPQVWKWGKRKGVWGRRRVRGFSVLSPSPEIIFRLAAVRNVQMSHIIHIQPHRLE